MKKSPAAGRKKPKSRVKPRAPRKAASREKTGKSRSYRVGKGKPPKDTQFKPGESGNPSGKPKGSNLQRLLKDALELESGGRSNGEVIAEKLVKKARAGDLRAIEIVLDRIEGKARQRVDIGGVDGAPIPLQVVETIDRFYGAAGKPVDSKSD